MQQLMAKLAARPVWAQALLAAQVPPSAAADADAHKRVAYMFRNGAQLASLALSGAGIA